MKSLRRKLLKKISNPPKAERKGEGRMGKLKQIQNKIQELRKQEQVLLEKDRKEKHIPMLKKFIGRYFSYRNNSYGDRTCAWDEFYKIIDLIGSNLIVENCSIDCYGRASLNIDIKFIYIDGRKPFDGENEEEITKEEYEKARSEVCSELLTQSKMREDLSH